MSEKVTTLTIPPAPGQKEAAADAGNTHDGTDKEYINNITEIGEIVKDAAAAEQELRARAEEVRRKFMLARDRDRINSLKAELAAVSRLIPVMAAGQPVILRKGRDEIPYKRISRIEYEHWDDEREFKRGGIAAVRPKVLLEDAKAPKSVTWVKPSAVKLEEPGVDIPALLSPEGRSWLTLMKKKLAGAQRGRKIFRGGELLGYLVMIRLEPAGAGKIKLSAVLDGLLKGELILPMEEVKLEEASK